MPIGGTESHLSTRLVICVDGTRYDTKSSSLQTNIYRIYASTNNGQQVKGQSGYRYNQVARYWPGISDADDVLSKDKLQAVLSGQNYDQQIRDVYEACCQLRGEHDEVAFFGFSSGAFVVRAVAGLLHQLGSLTSAGSETFAKDYKEARRHSESLSRTPTLSLIKSRSLTSRSTLSTVYDFRPAPRIVFLGAFDTIRAINDEAAYDISFNPSIQHLRHALALHEDRRNLEPECIYSKDLGTTRLQESGRSEVQSWFIGTHNDIGGVSMKAGLSLYPVQWMLLEAKACGLWIDFQGISNLRSDVVQPLAAVFPTAANGKATAKASFVAANGIVTAMQDLREVHDQPQYRDRYAVKLATKPGSVRLRKQRSPFDANGDLKGYCDHLPQGTILHPSVYFLLDEYCVIMLDTKETKLQRQIEEWRERMLGTQNGAINHGFWDDHDGDDAVDPGAIRVLVCGNTGVGKSTLINKTFGVNVTESSDRSRGIHDVKTEIRFEGRPDLIVHDSGGFEAGGDDEFLAIEEFLKEKSSVTDIQHRLHVIWFCIEINSARTLQKATEKLFQAVGMWASEVPIVVVATKKDDLLDLEFSKRRKELKKNKEPFDEEVCEQYAEQQLQSRLEQIRSEMESVPGGRLDALVAVSQEDDDSIAALSKTTSHCFDTDKVRLLYIRAQVTRIDLKVDMALHEVMSRYRRLTQTASAVSLTVVGPTVHRKTAATRICRAIMNCFGLPTVSADSAIAALKANVWSNLSFDPSVALAECLNAIGYVGTGFAMGIPVFLVTGALGAPLVVPSTCRLFLTMSCDLILTLVRSFREVAFRESAMPRERDVHAAARIYRIRGYAEHVHGDIRKLLPKRNVTACYRYPRIKSTVEAFLNTYREKLTDNAEGSLKGLSLGGSADQLSRTTSSTGDDEDDDSVVYREIRAANAKAAELEARGPMAEMAGEREAAELDSTHTGPPRHELDTTETARHELEDTARDTHVKAQPRIYARPSELEG